MPSQLRRSCKVRYRWGKKPSCSGTLARWQQEVGIKSDRQQTNNRTFSPSASPTRKTHTSKHYHKQHRARQQRKRGKKQSSLPCFVGYGMSVYRPSTRRPSVRLPVRQSVYRCVPSIAVPERQPRTTYRAQKKTPHEQPTIQPTRVKITHPLIPRKQQTSAVSLDQCDRQNMDRQVVEKTKKRAACVCEGRPAVQDTRAGACLRAIQTQRRDGQTDRQTDRDVYMTRSM